MNKNRNYNNYAPIKYAQKSKKNDENNTYVHRKEIKMLLMKKLQDTIIN